MRMRFKGLCVMPAAAVGCVLLAANTAAQNAIGTSVPTPLVAIENEPTPKLIVDPPTDCGPSACCGTPAWDRLNPVSGGERAHRTSVRDGGAQRISTGWTSPYTRRRPALVVGGR